MAPRSPRAARPQRLRFDAVGSQLLRALGALDGRRGADRCRRPVLSPRHGRDAERAAHVSDPRRRPGNPRSDGRPVTRSSRASTALVATLRAAPGSAYTDPGGRLGRRTRAKSRPRDFRTDCAASTTDTARSAPCSTGRPLCIADVKDVALLLALAEREARLWARWARASSIRRRTPSIVSIASPRIVQLDAQNARATRARSRSGSATTISPTFRSWAIARIGERIAGNVGVEALKLKLASMGITRRF